MLEGRLIEVTLRVRVRIEEEALGAAFHRGDRQVGYIVLDRCQNLKGFLRMRPVFFRMEPTFESSFFSASVALAGVGVGLGAVFLTGAAAATEGLGGSGFGSSTDGCASGVGFTSGTGFDVLAALDSTGGMSLSCVAVR